MKLLTLLVLLLIPLLGQGQQRQTDNPEEANYDIRSMYGDLDDIAARGFLRILVTHSQTDFFFDQGRIRGIQYEMALEFLKHINKGRTNRYHASEANRIFPQFIPVTFAQLIPALQQGKGDIAAAFLTITPERQEQIDFVSPEGREASEILIAHRDAPEITRKADLSGKRVYVLKDSSYAKHLGALNEMLAIAELPPVEVVEADEQLLTEDILELVNAGIVAYTVCDDFKAELWSKVLPNIRLETHARISEGQHIGWGIRKDSPELQDALKRYMGTVRKGTYLGNILFNKYFDNTRWIDNPLTQSEREKFNQLIHLFTEYGDRYGFDPLALAAQAYQESRFDQSLRSHRGAIGIMQLLPTTANDPNVGIPDIEELENNIHAGTKYMDFLRNRYFSDDNISAIDQRLFSWAAYNAGPANITRARDAAQEAGLDPNVWFGNVENMAARKISREPVRYVASIYKYYTAYRLIEKSGRDRSDALRAVLTDEF